MAQKDRLKEWDQLQNEIEAAIQDLVRKGLLFDTGKRRWSERKRRYEVVWAATEAGKLQ
jgi:hypothetical protein